MRGRKALAIVKDTKRLAFQERVAAFIEKRRVVLFVAFEIKVPGVVYIVRLKDRRFPAFGRRMASNDVTRDRRNDSKSERSDGKDANHCGERTVVVRRERRASWM